MIADVIIGFDEGPYLIFEIIGSVAVVEQNAVLQRLMPALDFSLGLRGVRTARAQPTTAPSRIVSRAITRSPLLGGYDFRLYFFALGFTLTNKLIGS
ncbi:hypothetical protein AB7M16_005064 [Bradyrhizobium sp. USDA 372]|uniref:Uncharacterized protein n=1 Tax=Bradyrhizobium yuanmingense TaxID=108015 RepID=A0A1C3XIJ8_9BRAD|nr:hypothetical protein IQ15_07301 [Bradyrhizobium yuanmingense]SCB52083.1 hypothetical protein GA0061099_10269 [Bradyrhizobium yuanmingense]